MSAKTRAQLEAEIARLRNAVEIVKKRACTSPTPQDSACLCCQAHWFALVGAGQGKS